MDVLKGIVAIGLLVIISNTSLVKAEMYSDMIQYKYDGLNRLQDASSGAGVAQEFTHDDVANRETEIRRNAPVGAPTAYSDVYSLPENSILNVNVASGVLNNDDTSNVTNQVAFQITQPLFGSFTLNQDGSFIYQPNPDYYGDDEFAYQIQSDTYSSNIVRVRLTIIPENPLPVANDDGVAPNLIQTVEDQNISIPVLSNDVNVSSIVSVGTPFHGSAVIQGNSILYMPSANYVGEDIFTYQAQGAEGISTAKVFVQVTPENDPPTLVDIEHWMDFGGSASIPALANASDPENGTLTLISANGATNGTLSLQGEYVIYTPTEFAPDGSGIGSPLMSEFITYTVEDNAGSQSQANIVIRVTDDSDANPITIDDCYNIDPDPPTGVDFNCTIGNTQYEIDFETPTLLSVIANDYDPSGEQLTITDVRMDVAFGTVNIQGDQVLLTPATGVQEQIIYFFYDIENSSGDASEDSGVVIAYVKKEDLSDDLPIARDDCYNASASSGCSQSNDYLIEYGTSTILNVLGNDFDPNNENLEIVFPASVFATLEGTVSVTQDNKIRYTPNGDGDINGFQDTFYYRIRNESGLQAEASVYLYVKPRDPKPPVARNDTFTVFKDEPKDLNLTSNDTDPNFDNLSIDSGSLSQPAHGTLQLINSSTVRYSPNNNSLNPDSFTYKVSDGTGLTSGTAFVTINMKEKPPLVPIIMLLLDEDEAPQGQE